MLDFLIELDTNIFLFLNDLHLPFFDYFMKAFTGKLIWAPMYALILFILYRRYGWKVATIFVLGTVLTVGLSDHICASHIRPYVERLRPSNILNLISPEVHIVDGYRGGAYGFPSCHAANSFALATFLSLLFSARRFTIFIYVWAFLNSYSRLYLGVHYPGDLIIGAMVGSTIAIGVYYLSKYIAYKISTPRTYYYKKAHGNIAVRGVTIAYHLSDLMIFMGCTISILILIYSVIAWI
ncbi:MAG: phosphatase PAP2 family protein [Muribaculaceae bacterium]|nr:phosphatase PAP2 family protein [Muribaculaceae bacterium]